MPRILLLAGRCRMNTGDLLAMAREVADDPQLRDVADLNRMQRQTIESFLELLLEPMAGAYTLAA